MVEEETGASRKKAVLTKSKPTPKPVSTIFRALLESAADLSASCAQAYQSFFLDLVSLGHIVSFRPVPEQLQDPRRAAERGMCCWQPLQCVTPHILSELIVGSQTEKRRKAENEDVFDFLLDIRDADGNRPGASSGFLYRREKFQAFIS
jgi:hypothetical protein